MNYCHTRQVFINGAEDDGVAADADGKREHDYELKTGGAAQPADGILDILWKARHS